MERSTGGPLLWRCRRGMKELDLLLERFAREQYPCAPGSRRRAFERLLDLPDPVLAELLLGPGELPGAAPADPDLAEVVALVATPGHR